jgi:hypothetical protein
VSLKPRLDGSVSGRIETGHLSLVRGEKVAETPSGVPFRCVL